VVKNVTFLYRPRWCMGRVELWVLSLNCKSVAGGRVTANPIPAVFSSIPQKVRVIKREEWDGPGM
jgi:hypothetical protein